MEISHFLIGLVGVVLADLVLAGDNAVVIALAARNLPAELRRRAIVIGASVAIALRVVLTVVAVFLLRAQLPWVQLVGGVALLVIGWQLAVEESDDDEGIDSARTLRGAIRTIVVADVVMSIDNVLAVAAIGKNSLVLIALGLLISIPIVMGGASVLLRLIDRFPVVTWIGAALIIYVGIELILEDPVLEHHVSHALSSGWGERAVAIAGAGIVTVAAALYRRFDRDPARSR